MDKSKKDGGGDSPRKSGVGRASARAEPRKSGVGRASKRGGDDAEKSQKPRASGVRKSKRDDAADPRASRVSLG